MAQISPYLSFVRGPCVSTGGQLLEQYHLMATFVPADAWKENARRFLDWNPGTSSSSLLQEAKYRLEVLSYITSTVATTSTPSVKFQPRCLTFGAAIPSATDSSKFHLLFIVLINHDPEEDDNLNLDFQKGRDEHRKRLQTRDPGHILNHLIMQNTASARNKQVKCGFCFVCFIVFFFCFFLQRGIYPPAPPTLLSTLTLDRWAELAQRYDPGLKMEEVKKWSLTDAKNNPGNPVQVLSLERALAVAKACGVDCKGFGLQDGDFQFPNHSKNLVLVFVFSFLYYVLL
jgi:hypothetical protein